MTTSKLFISYPSESWNFAQRIAENLAPHIEQSIFIDYRSINKVDFAASILDNLRSCDAVLLIMTDFTFADIHRDDDWLRIEIRTALEHNIPIVLVRENGLLPPKDLPADIRDVNRSQGIPFYREFFDPGINMLVEFLLRIDVVTHRISRHAPAVIQPHAPPAQAPAPEPQRTIGGQGSVEEAADLIEAGDFEKALVILKALKEGGALRSLVAKFVHDLTIEAEVMQASAEHRREAEVDYLLIAGMAKRKLTEANARTAFAEWREKYADLVDELDTETLWKKFVVQAPPQRIITPPPLPAPFAWMEIRGGRGTMKAFQRDDVTLDIPIPTQTYWMSKYPITNAQYAKFIEAGGYDRQKWWTATGWKWKQDTKYTTPRYWDDSRWNRAEKPVVGVFWYEAVAFCLWLSETTGEKIMLPTEAQWQYAAQGNDGRVYPWGNDWDATRCNNNSNIGRTTPVTQFEGKGDSPFGVVDMAGNVFEWCLTDYEDGTNDIDRAAWRVLRGGSWIDDSGDLRVAFRSRYNTMFHTYFNGFRIALS